MRLSNMILFIFSFLLSLYIGTVNAGVGTISASYARGDFKGITNDIDGINAKFRYDFEHSQWGGISSLTYVEHSGYKRDEIYSKQKYGSISAGPVLRLNEWSSIYGLIGVGAGSRELTHSDSIRYGLNYGVGLQLNPTNEIAFDFGYEKNRIGNIDMNIWMVGIGYRY